MLVLPNEITTTVIKMNNILSQTFQPYVMVVQTEHVKRDGTKKDWIRNPVFLPVKMYL